MGTQQRNKAFSLRTESAKYLGNLGTIPLLGKLFAKKECRMYSQIHCCLSIMLGEHLSTFQLRTVMLGKAGHTQTIFYLCSIGALFPWRISCL